MWMPVKSRRAKMTKKKNHPIPMIFRSIILLSTALFSNKLETLELINMAGEQRMLSQRIAKDYLYVGKNISTMKANRQLETSMKDFVRIHKQLLNAITDPEIKNILAFVELSSNDFKTTSKKEFNLDNAQLVLDLSESMLEGSQYIVGSLQNSLEIKNSNVVNQAGIQRMLSQRIAKYYIAYQLGIQDENTINSMKETIKQFSQNLDTLIKNRSNTPQINIKLDDINRLWKIVYKFYNNIEKGGLPLIVFNSTDKITKKMDEITKLYIAIHKQ
ncbi:MAG TPA: hypothetical protein EYG67_01755 [Campylobacterales bacterium]|nr:hypothetical protein [Campylobacterales bacterium]